jgi:hypothetical protein
MVWPFLYFAHDRLSPAELSAARLDGDLVEIGEGYMPADAVESVAMRAASLAPLCSERLAVGIWSAAWIYGALHEPPARHSLVRAPGRRVGNLISRRAVFHDTAIDAHDVTLLGDVRVTTPLRTLTDIARRADRESDPSRATAAARGLIETGLVTATAGRDFLAGHPGLPGCRRGDALLARIAGGAASSAQEDVTR